jgi:hypothetical protein
MDNNLEKENEIKEYKSMTNNERVVYNRAKKMGITIEEYRKKYPKGYDWIKKE